MFEQGLELSVVGKHSYITCLYRDWNCLQFGNIGKLHFCAGNGTVCSTVTLKSYMYLQGLELYAVR